MGGRGGGMDRWRLRLRLRLQLWLRWGSRCGLIRYDAVVRVGLGCIESYGMGKGVGWAGVGWDEMGWGWI